MLIHNAQLEDNWAEHRCTCSFPFLQDPAKGTVTACCCTKMCDHSIWIKRLERDFLTGDREVTTSGGINRSPVVERKIMEYEEFKRNQSWLINHSGHSSNTGVLLPGLGRVQNAV